MRERLIELIADAVGGCSTYWAGLIADYLLKNGVIVPPCKVGDTVYNVLPIKLILEEKVERFYVRAQTDKGIIPIDMFGKTVFLTKQEAEQALKARDERK